MAEQDQDKTEQATSFKLKEARKRGQVSKSMEMNSFALLVVALLFSSIMGVQILEDVLKVNANIFNWSGQAVFSEGSILSLYEMVVDELFSIFAMLLGAIMVTSIFVNVTQTGPIFTFHPIKPDLQRINPVAGFKRVFSIRMLFDFIKTVIKISLLSLVAYFSLKSFFPDIIRLIEIDVKTYGTHLVDLSSSLLGKLLIVIFFIAIIDVAFTRRDFSKKMMMSRRELKDEVKRRDGDPRVKSKLRELQREAAKRSGSLQKVPDSDILITNPTHISIAIAYDKENMQAPTLLAKGSGELAGKMRQVAAKNNIPIFEDKALARELFKKVDIDNCVPEAHYRTIAKLLVIAYRLKNKNIKPEVGK